MTNLEHQKPNGEWVDCNDKPGKCRYPQRQKARGKGSTVLGRVGTQQSPKEKKVKESLGVDVRDYISDHMIDLADSEHQGGLLGRENYMVENEDALLESAIEDIYFYTGVALNKEDYKGIAGEMRVKAIRETSPEDFIKEKKRIQKKKEDRVNFISNEGLSVFRGMGEKEIAEYSLNNYSTIKDDIYEDWKKGDASKKGAGDVDYHGDTYKNEGSYEGLIDKLYYDSEGREYFYILESIDGRHSISPTYPVKQRNIDSLTEDYYGFPAGALENARWKLHRDEELRKDPNIIKNDPNRVIVEEWMKEELFAYNLVERQRKHLR